MAISEEERVLFYELVEVPNDTDVLNIDGQFGTGLKFVDYAVTTAKTEIDAKLDALTGEPLSRLQTILAQFKTIALDSTRIRPNTSNEGVDVDPRRARALLRRHALTIVPVFVAGRDLSGADGSIPLG